MFVPLWQKLRPNLKGGWRHSDQYAVYVTFVLAMILFLLIQFLAFLFMVLSQSAQEAAPFFEHVYYI